MQALFGRWPNPACATRHGAFVSQKFRRQRRLLAGAPRWHQRPLPRDGAPKAVALRRPAARGSLRNRRHRGAEFAQPLWPLVNITGVCYPRQGL